MRRQVLQALQLDQRRTVQARREQRRLLVALDERALDLLLLRYGRQGEYQE